MKFEFEENIQRYKSLKKTGYLFLVVLILFMIVFVYTDRYFLADQNEGESQLSFGVILLGLFALTIVFMRRLKTIKAVVVNDSDIEIISCSGRANSVIAKDKISRIHHMDTSLVIVSRGKSHLSIPYSDELKSELSKFIEAKIERI